ncbi:MAG: hypothetical protein HZC54_19405 [Verrucomicrobia bacterium]|nr:hypothetical protein [Verrucomicrobiota bacterium]
MISSTRWLIPVLALFAIHTTRCGAEPASVSGIYPSLATFNNEGECGTGAVVPWADRLWVISYGPHLPTGSSDKLYEITPDLRQIIRPESIGGTPANRMIHRESRQLIIGPYFIDEQRNVRVIPYTQMPGRHTGNARHLTDPAGKVYFATMEEGLYEVDVKTLEVRGFIRDGNFKKPFPGEQHPATLDSQLPGYHGKGFYCGQGRLVYANNGERDKRIATDPTIPSGALAEWRGEGDWQMVRRNQFTEVTGPGGIHGNPNPDTDPIWSVGWDHRSLILMLLDGGKWHAYRLPKASHCYDGSHGWNTEWPRIRDIGPEGAPDLMMTMHGTFWRFPKTFTARSSAGIAPRSTCLKVVGDFCRWGDRIVLGCDDTAKSEFLNKRKLKGEIAGPGQSQSNLRFMKPEEIEQLGPPLGRGAVWLDDDVKGGVASEPFLFSGYGRRALHLANGADKPVRVTLEVDAKGNSTWKNFRDINVAARGSAWTAFKPQESGAWVRLKTDRDCAKLTAFFHYSNADRRGTKPAAMFAGLAEPGDKAVCGGLLHARGGNLRTLRFAAQDASGDLGSYILDAGLKLRRDDDPKGMEWMRKNVPIPQNVITEDAASVLIEEKGKRWRLPKGDAAFDRPSALGDERIDREVCTERDLLNVHGTFYELPAENAGGMAKVRPVATHNRRIKDYASYRGLLVMSGVAADAPRDNPHVIRSDDAKCALWAGTVDDLWQFGKPRGVGGPWKDTAVKANEPSDPYLMTGYDQKSLTLSHDVAGKVSMRVEVDISGTGQWVTYRSFDVPAGKKLKHTFPAEFAAYWVRVVANRDAKATAAFIYGAD